MNNIFQTKRFGLLLKRQWLDFGRIYLISLLVVAGILSLFYFLNLKSDFDKPSSYALSFRVPLFSISGIIFLSIIASNYFAQMGQKSRAAIELLLPASITEKFLAGVFFTAILSLLSYLLIFYIVDMAFVSALRKAVIDNAAERFPHFFNDFDHVFKSLYAMPFLISSIFLLGSIAFNRFHYIKTLIITMIVTGVWAFVVVKAGAWLFEGRVPLEGYNHSSALNSKDMAEWLSLALVVFFTLFFWTIAYLRLKEKEV